MFVQIISLTAPLNHIAQLRELVSSEYLPALRNRPGFVAAHLLEQVDDPDSAQLVVYWDDQQSVEDAAKTGVLAGSTQSIAARMPGLRIQRQSYVVRVAVSDRRAQHVAV